MNLQTNDLWFLKDQEKINEQLANDLKSLFVKFDKLELKIDLMEKYLLDKKDNKDERYI